MHRKDLLITGNVYHIFNRGVNRGPIFFNDGDYQRFIDAAEHYVISNHKFSYERYNQKPNLLNKNSSINEEPKVEILAYCLMPNHFHFVVKQIRDKGVTDYFGRLTNSYSHYVNLKYDRVGPLFQGRFRNVLVESEEQLLHLSRYVHLNPLVAGLVSNLRNYHWSSYRGYLGADNDSFCTTDMVKGHFSSASGYEKFVLDQADYAMELYKIKHLGLDNA